MSPLVAIQIWIIWTLGAIFCSKDCLNKRYATGLVIRMRHALQASRQVLGTRGTNWVTVYRRDKRTTEFCTNHVVTVDPDAAGPILQYRTCLSFLYRVWVAVRVSRVAVEVEHAHTQRNT